jgi:hypothetical protein
MRWSLLAQEPPLRGRTERVECITFVQEVEDRRPDAWVAIVCASCGTESNIYRDHPLAAA